MLTEPSAVAPDAGFNLFNKLSDYQRISRELTSASGATALGSAMTSRRYRARFCCGGITGGTEKRILTLLDSQTKIARTQIEELVRALVVRVLLLVLPESKIKVSLT